MHFLEQAAERAILEAMARGDFDNLPGKGRPLPDETELESVPAELRMGYRLLKNSGYLPEEVQIRRDIESLLIAEEFSADSAAGESVRRRLLCLLDRLGEQRGSHLRSMEYYYQRIAERLGSHAGKVQVGE